MNFLGKYIFWFYLIFFLGILLFSLGIYFFSMDYFLFMDWEILTINSCSLVMTLLLDWMSLIFMGSVMFISSMVIYYSHIYMMNDFHSDRFLILVLLFILSMMFMIISPNLVSILLGWDGLGLVSYCLVIYFQNYKSYNAGMLTVLTNRIGDVCIILGIGWLFNSGSWHFLYYNLYFNDWGYILFLFIILAAFTKSAQIPFSSWLPAAMAAPTPVSALVHSSTLVTAGVYLLIRFSNLLYQFNLSFFLVLSMLTMFMSGLGANFEYDLKKIIALSTLSQLGLMMSILFIGYPVIAYFHLLTHAFFKALLFLCAGLIIHCMNDSQDIRHMGGLVNQLPYTSTCFSIANFSLCGLPFLSGFYSKDLVLETLTFSYFNLFIYLLFFLSVGLTVSYSTRLMYYIMTEYKGFMSSLSFHEDFIMNKSMIFLVFMGIFSGSMLSWLLFPFPDLLVMSLECKLMPLLFVMLGGWIGYEMSFMSWIGTVSGLKTPLLINFLGSMWFMPNFSTYYIYNYSLYGSKLYFDFMDMGWGEYIMSKMTITYMLFLSKLLLFYQNNNVKIFFCTFILLTFMLIII
uniref:NADH-ubiquinone oxidoreductase chain 5 n=1 Tax=Grypocephalus pallipectus TaxID=2813436 RepID=A0A8T9EH65_9HEMI|nr:NADH dehydrogenase subunit 5 [Grypocephalus pallipectus]UNA71181.1 NADH dehydrogenase subunit 5 [Grypocephalus pallipectus]UPL65773.1 NADH dehydrogenase subunit 5 [Grypocephalus pallipectus]